MPSKKQIVKEVQEKKLIFTVTAGRTGTTFLTNLFSIFPNVASFHEPEPNYVHFLRRTQSSPIAANKFLLNYKLPAIAKCSSGTYIETSHLFCKGFLEPLLKLEIFPNLILLRRHPREIATSLLERNTVPERTPLGLSYLLSPRDPNSLPLIMWEGLTDYQLCFWYALEIERRQRRYRMMLLSFSKTVIDVTARELGDPDVFISMAKELSLDISDRDYLLSKHLEISGVSHNKNLGRLALSLDYESEEQTVWERISYYDPLLQNEVCLRYGKPQI